MRKTKFRGKDSLTGEWRFGDLLTVDDEVFIIPEGGMGMDGHHIRQSIDRPLEVEPETVGEYTGCLDKDKKEIFEGDIVECVSWNEYFSDSTTGKTMEPFRRTMKVAFLNGGFKMVEPMPSPMKDNVWDIIFNGDIIVIGNIHENPGLLKDKENFFSDGKEVK